MTNDIRYYQLWNEEAQGEPPQTFVSLTAADSVCGSRERMLEERVARQDKIIAALVKRVENSADQHANAYSLFQAAIMLDEEVRARTAELHATLHELETINAELTEAKETAERLSATKSRFLAAAGHDLLQPLNAARLSLSALKEEDLAPDAESLAAQIDRSLSSVEQLMRALMDISKLDAGATQPECCSFPIERILQSLYWDFAHSAKQKDLRLRVLTSRANVFSDPVFLRRILQNLMSNAIRYTNSGGVLLACTRRNRELAVSVIDTGTGIDEDEQDAVFDEFHRGSSPAAQVKDGLGLGLAIAKRMAEALGHRLSFRSQPGRGTVFSVTMPLSEAMPVGGVSGIERKAFMRAHEGAFVIVIENDESGRIAMENLLSRWSCQVISVAGIDECLDALAEIERTPDLIIADYLLGPAGSGLDAIKAVSQRFAQDVPGLIVTADHSHDVARKVSEAGHTLLTKPVEPAELRAVMSHILTKHKAPESA
ncbi:MAG: ATP-binding protein [Dichotomicrobium sp.]